MLIDLVFSEGLRTLVLYFQVVILLYWIHSVTVHVTNVKLYCTDMLIIQLLFNELLLHYLIPYSLLSKSIKKVA